MVLGSKKKVEVPVAIVNGSEIVELKIIEFEKLKMSAIWYKGDRFESQTSLALNFGDIKSTIYDLELKGRTGPLNVIEKGSIRFQCWMK